MRVSWIDADHLNALLAQLAPQETQVDEAPQAVEIDTVPALSFSAESAAISTDWMAPDAEQTPVAAATAVAAVEPEPAEPAPQGMLAEPEAGELEDEDDHGRPLHNAAAALPLSRIRDKLRAIRQRATAAGILTHGNEAARPGPAAASETPAVVDDQIETAAPMAEPPGTGEGGLTANAPEAIQPEPETMLAEPQTPAFEIPQGSQAARLAAFASWARQVLHEDGGHVLVMSDDGEMLWGGEAKAGLVLSTMMAWGAASRASALSACGVPPVIRQPLASGHVLTVIPCETAGGIVHAAVAAPAGLPDAIAAVLRGALCAAMNDSIRAETAPATV